MDFEDFLSSGLGMGIVLTAIPIFFWLIYFLAKTYKETREDDPDVKNK